MLRDMLARGVPPDHFTLLPVLRSCALTGAAGFGASSHALAVKLGAQDNLFVASALASDTSIEPHVVTVSNLDLIARIIQTSMFCVYAKPPAGDFDAVVAAFDAGMPSFLNHFFPLAGRIATDNTSYGVPEIHCSNQGAELVKIQLPYGKDMALSVQVVFFACGGFTVAWRTNHIVVDGDAPRASPAEPRPLDITRPRVPPCYSASLDDAFTPLDARCQVNVLTADHSSVLRFYYIEASDIARLREVASPGGERATRV
ncbi:omega-hydroxypalmitate O-feruloyl transferase-like [Panicum miliaceum]|uniref:Omega-hydroxypalmitate O-feruloyl transferase-like n=1 Tax=Panicum miliaceum TaxID=4540 RepID=A0A3L6Q347_PANMI|nr:omega-hydroxypalmitate O-feruloyl transferase-like [Panicum miliaceum]